MFFKLELCVFRFSLIVVTMSAMLGCNSTFELDPQTQQPKLQQQWQQEANAQPIQEGWLNELKDPQVFSLVNQALAGNYALSQAYIQTQILAKQLDVREAQQWPSIDLAAQANRAKDNRPVSYTNASSINLSLQYEIDIWGKLSAQQREAYYNYQNQWQQYQQSRQQLVADVIIAWFTAISNQQLYDIYLDRIKIAKQSLNIIEDGYKQGLNESLDVYLARNDYANEQANLNAQFALLQQSKRELERLTGQYPSASLVTKAELPTLEQPIPVGIPSELITRKPQLQAAWFDLLTKDAALAYAHKQRFPSISLTASLGDSTDRVSDLFSPTELAWSLVGNISAPLFNAGELQASEDIARLSLKQTEQAYLDSIYSAFNNVENGITNERSLQQQYTKTREAFQNAKYAYELSFEQYRSGIETYTTVLEAQDRTYSAQSALVNIKLQLLSNRINLHLALGGSFEQVTQGPTNNG